MTDNLGIQMKRQELVRHYDDFKLKKKLFVFRPYSLYNIYFIVSWCNYNKWSQYAAVSDPATQHDP